MDEDGHRQVRANMGVALFIETLVSIIEMLASHDGKRRRTSLDSVKSTRLPIFVPGNEFPFVELR